MHKPKERGAIHAERAYAMGKMLEHSSWNLPRKITPSDFDMVIDNDGRIIFVEISRLRTSWQEIDYGQSTAYLNAIKHGDHIAVLCKHSVDPDYGEPIDTRHDVESFQPMLWQDGRKMVCEIFHGNHLWKRFVDGWFKNPMMVRDKLVHRALRKDISR